MDWQRVDDALHRDPAPLRDIYIQDTSLSDWSRIWALLKADESRLIFLVDGKNANIPRDVAEVFHLTASHGVCATRLSGKLKLNCRFFCVGMIELDFDPLDIDSPTEAARLIELIEALGVATSKEVRLTEQNDIDAIIARFDPVSRSVIWTSASP